MNSYGPRIVTDGLVLCLDAADRNSYPGTGSTWGDLSGNENNGTFGASTAAPTFSGDNGGVLSFDGNDYVGCGNPSSLNFGTGNFTLLFAAYRTGTGFQGGSYVGKGNGTTLGFDFRDSNFFLYGTNGLIAQRGFFTTLNVWEHHTIVYDSSSSPYVKFYRNGSFLSSSTTNNSANVSSINTTNSFRIGLSTAGGSNRYFIGRIPLVSVYNRALTNSEIRQNFEATKGRFGL